jgi:hypothetical protein
VALAARTYEVIVPPTARGLVRPATEMRGTMLANSMAILRERGREPEYFAALPARHHEEVRFVLAQAWMPMELAVVHYEAMGRVFPDVREQVENGRVASERTQNGWIRTVARTLQATGSLDIPSVLKRLPQGVERFCRGGGSVAVYRTGLKDARIELDGYPFVHIEYARNAWQGMFESALSLITPRLFIRQDLRFAQGDRMALTVAWV